MGDLIPALFNSDLSQVEQAPSRWEYVCTNHRGRDLDISTKQWLNEKGAQGYQLLHAYVIPDSDVSSPVHVFVMGRRVESTKMLRDLAEDGMKLKQGWAAIQRATEELQARAQELSKQKDAVAATADKLEKIRQGMIEDGELKLHPKAIEMLREMGPEGPTA
jgi:hypothetical protein